MVWRYARVWSVAQTQSLRFRPQTLIQKRRFPKEEPMSSGAIDDQQSIFGMLISLLSFTHHPRASPLSPCPHPLSYNPLPCMWSFCLSSFPTNAIFFSLNLTAELLQPLFSSPSPFPSNSPSPGLSHLPSPPPLPPLLPLCPSS